MAVFEDPSNTINNNRFRILASPGNILRFPNSDIPYKMLLSFKEYTYSPGDSLINGNVNYNASVANPRGSIVLPLPLQLNDTTGVDATVTSATGAAILTKALEAGTGKNTDIFTLDNMALFADLIGKGLTGAATAAAAAGNKKTAAALGVVSGVAAAATSDTAQLLGGFAINPFETMQFKSVKLKQHSFTWRLSPSSIGESESLRIIINMIKSNILPSYFDDNVNTAHALLKYPAIASISFYGIDQNYYYKLKPAMITSFNVRYNGDDQLNVYRGGKPAIVDLSMDLVELTIHTAADYGGPTYESSGTLPSLPTANDLGLIEQNQSTTSNAI